MTVSFNGNSYCGVNDVQKCKTKGKGGFAPAAASAVLPGMGQYLDGRKKKAKHYMNLAAITGLLTSAFGFISAHKISKENKVALETGQKAVKSFGAKFAGAAAIASGVATLGVYVASIIDAYKGGKPTQKKTYA